MDYIETSYFLEELNKSWHFRDFDLFVSRKGNWLSAKNGETILDAALVRMVDEKPKQGYLKKVFDDDAIALFWLANNQAVVRINIKKKTRDSTLKAILQDLKNILKSANMVILANHDPLTGLLNRNGVRLGLERHLQPLPDNIVDQESEQSPTRTNQVVIYSFDIDHFKQVNDTYGHGVGDSILKIFASRLKFATQELEARFSNAFILSRPGGEEFELISIGSNHRTQLNEISEHILKSIRTPPIPSGSEIVEVQKSAGSPENIPQKILASIGVAQQEIKSTGPAIDELIETIRKKADLALYRAKSDGRDCVRYFEDIRLNHGRVIEYHSASDLVIIDIGAAVNVKNGDIFKVFFPPFTGYSECFVDDGRTKKLLGTYIPIESAQIRVLDTQEKISTCMVVSKRTDGPIPTGALLKRIAVGSKPIFVEPRLYGATQNDRARLVETIQNHINNHSLLAVLNLQPLLTEINQEPSPQLLADYATTIHMIFPAGTEVFVGDGFNCFVTMKTAPSTNEDIGSDSDDDVEQAASYVESFILKLEKLTKSYSGVFLMLSKPNGVSVSVEIALHFARAALKAALKAPRNKPAIRFFQPSQTLVAWRNETYTDETIADYISFKTYGVTDSSMENQLGLSILAADDVSKFQLAELAFITAHQQKPDFKVFAANAALVKARLGKFDEAYKLFDQVGVAFFEKKFSPIYLISYAKSAIEVNKVSVIDSAKLDEVLEGLIQVTENKTIKMHPIYDTWTAELRNASLNK